MNKDSSVINLFGKCIVAGLLLTTLLFCGCVDEQEGVVSEGWLRLQLTDKPGDLNITAANVTISEIRVHMASAGNNSTAGWYSIVEEEQEFDLIQLQNVTELLGETNLSAGKYTQIRLEVVSAEITINGTDVFTLTIPSGEVKLIKGFWIYENETTVLTLDFDVYESVHQTGNGKFMMRPTIKVIEG
jgi:hypothetical protein